MNPAILKTLFQKRTDQFVKLLLHFDNVVNTSTSIIDSSLAPHIATVLGNAQIVTAQSKFGGSSINFDGTGDYLTYDGSSDFAFGTTDFTIDFWMRINAGGAQAALIDFRPTAGNGFYPALFIDAANTPFYYVNSTTVITGGAALSTGVWYHIALARSGTSTKLFVDGVQTGATFSDSSNYINAATRPIIAAQGSGSQFFNGWMDELRISKGIARWTDNFTPPTAPYE